MKTVIVTGLLGSGKSAVCDFLRSRGVPESEARALQMLSFLSPVIPEGREEEIIQAIH